MSYLKSFSHSFQKIRHQGIVPEVCEPHSGAINIHGTRQEEAGAWKAKWYIQKIELESMLKMIFTKLKK